MYGDNYSRKWDLIVAHIDTDYLQTVSGSVEYQTSFNRILKQRRIKGWQWDSSPLEFDIEFFSPNAPITEAAQEQIKSVLFNQPTYQKLFVDPSEDDSKTITMRTIKREYIECVFTEPVVIEGIGGVWGYKCKCLTSSAMALQESITVDLGIEESTDVQVDTNIKDYVYPRLTIQCAASCNRVVVENETLNESMIISNEINGSATNALNGKILIVDCAAGIILDNTGISYYDYLFNKNFFRLFQGANEISVTGDVTSCQLIFQNSRWFR